MDYIFITINSAIGLFLAKYFFYRIYQSEFKKVVFAQNFLKKFFFIPFSSVNIKTSLRTKALLSEVIGFGTLFIFSVGCLYFYKENSVQLFEVVIHYFFYFFLCSSLLYLAIFDLLTFSVPESFTKKILFWVIVFNILVGLTRYINFRVSGEVLLQNLNLGNIDNLAFYLIFSLGTFLFVKISKEKGIGIGDIDILGIVGLALGWPFSLIALALIFIIGGLISSLYALKIKKFKGVIIPLVPFILIGFTVAINFSELIISLLLS